MHTDDRPREQSVRIAVAEDRASQRRVKQSRNVPKFIKRVFPAVESIRPRYSR